MPEREYVAPPMSKAESELRERFDVLWHDNKDRQPKELFLELLCAVLYPHKEETQAATEIEAKPVRR